MWDQLEAELNNAFKNKTSLPTAIACKSVLEFWKRFMTVWTQEAGLSILPDMHSLMIQTFISNLKPQHGLMVKQMISDWPTKTIPEFTEKDAAGCFDILKGPGTCNSSSPTQGMVHSRIEVGAEGEEEVEAVVSPGHSPHKEVALTVGTWVIGETNVYMTYLNKTPHKSHNPHKPNEDARKVVFQHFPCFHPHIIEMNHKC